MSYTMLLLNEEPLTSSELDIKCEAWLKEGYGVETDFEVDDSLQKLVASKLVTEEDDGRLRAVPLEKALEILDKKWDNYFTYNNDGGGRPSTEGQKAAESSRSRGGPSSSAEVKAVQGAGALRSLSLNKTVSSLKQSSTRATKVALEESQKLQAQLAEKEAEHQALVSKLRRQQGALCAKIKELDDAMKGLEPGASKLSSP